MRIVVVGGNAAGLTAASRAKRLDPSCFVTVLEAGRRIAYSICGLPFAVAGAGASSGERPAFDELVLFTPERLRNERGIEALPSTRVTELVPSGKHVIFQSARGERERLAYDKLLLATGYRPRRLDVEGASLPGVFTASRLSDGEALLSWIGDTRARRAVLIGGGYVGLEMAEALTRRGLSVTLVEASSHIFSSLDGDMAERLEEGLRRNGVELLTGRRVARLEERRGHGVEAVVLREGSLRLPADVVFVDVGVEPETSLAASAGLALAPTGGIAVSEYMETSVSSIFAAGNCVATRHLVSGRAVPMPLGTIAAKQGRVAGENLVGRRVAFAGALGTSIVRVFDQAAARTGLGEAEAKRDGFSVVAATVTDKFRAGYVSGGAPATVKVVAERGSGRWLGAQIVGSPEGATRIDIAAAAITVGMTVERASQLDLAYTPPLGTLWNPLLVALNQVKREL